MAAAHHPRRSAPWLRELDDQLGIHARAFRLFRPRRLRQREGREGRVAFAREALTSHGRISTPVRIPNPAGPSPRAIECRRTSASKASTSRPRWAPDRGNHRRGDHDHRLSAKVTARVGSFLCKSSSIAPRIRRSRAESRMPFLHPHVLKGLAHGHGVPPHSAAGPAKLRRRSWPPHEGTCPPSPGLPLCGAPGRPRVTRCGRQVARTTPVHPRRTRTFRRSAADAALPRWPPDFRTSSVVGDASAAPRGEP
jgi:hypothetical protein